MKIFTHPLFFDFTGIVASYRGRRTLKAENNGTALLPLAHESNGDLAWGRRKHQRRAKNRARKGVRRNYIST
jgi:hypothetical protein